VKSVVYRVRVAKVNSNALAVRIPALFARILRIAKSSNVNVICYDSKIVVKPL
jgi:antitoxin component of MazEF toxin-antitoxin module